MAFFTNLLILKKYDYRKSYHNYLFLSFELMYIIFIIVIISFKFDNFKRKKIYIFYKINFFIFKYFI